MVFHSSATRKDADSAAVASASVETCVFVQRFAVLDIILQSLYHALCTFSGPYKCGLLAIFINFVFYLSWYRVSQVARQT